MTKFRITAFDKENGPVVGEFDFECKSDWDIGDEVTERYPEARYYRLHQYKDDGTLHYGGSEYKWIGSAIHPSGKEFYVKFDWHHWKSWGG